MTQRHDNLTDLLLEADLVRPCAIRAAATVGLFEALNDKSLNEEGLANLLSLNKEHLRNLCGYLCDIGWLRKDDNGCYALTPDVEKLITDQALSSLIDERTAMGIYSASIVDLVNLLKDGKSFFESRFKKDYWSYVSAQGDLCDEVARYSPKTPSFDACSLTGLPEWSRVRRVLDIGGGNGNMLIAISERHPHVEGCVLDLANRVASADSLIRDCGLQDRLRTISGDFFQGIPSGFDCYLLNSVLADWSDDKALRILENVAGAMRSSDILIISEVVDLRTSTDYGSKLTLSCATGGLIRSPEEIRILAKNASLSQIGETTNTPSRFTMMFCSSKLNGGIYGGA